MNVWLSWIKVNDTIFLVLCCRAFWIGSSDRTVVKHSLSTSRMPLFQNAFGAQSACWCIHISFLFEQTVVSDEMKDTICVYLTHHMHLCVFAYADWSLQPSGYWLSSNHRGLEWLRGPSYGAAQLAVDPGSSCTSVIPRCGCENSVNTQPPSAANTCWPP